MNEFSMNATDAYRIGIKLFLDPATPVDLEKVIPIFHGWIQNQSLPGHLLIDVADYSHVKDGPGVVVVGHESNVALDEAAGRPGFYYARKRPHGGPFAQRFAEILGHALAGAKKVAADASVRFISNEVLVRVNDRLAAPNTPEVFAALKDEIARCLHTAGGSQPTLEHHADPNIAFEVLAKFECGGLQ